MNWRQLRDKKITLVGGAVSGGLDSCTATHWLSAKGLDVHGFIVDLGQPDEEDLDAVAECLGFGLRKFVGDQNDRTAWLAHVENSLCRS